MIQRLFYYGHVISNEPIDSCYSKDSWGFPAPHVSLMSGYMSLGMGLIVLNLEETAL